MSEIRGRGIATGKHVVQDALLRKPQGVRRYDGQATGGATKSGEPSRQAAPMNRHPTERKIVPPK